jgi:hypothetical protein
LTFHGKANRSSREHKRRVPVHDNGLAQLSCGEWGLWLAPRCAASSAAKESGVEPSQGVNIALSLSVGLNDYARATFGVAIGHHKTNLSEFAASLRPLVNEGSTLNEEASKRKSRE